MEPGQKTYTGGIVRENNYVLFFFFSLSVITIWEATEYFRKMNLLFNFIYRKRETLQEHYRER